MFEKKPDLKKRECGRLWQQMLKIKVTKIYEKPVIKSSRAWYNGKNVLFMCRSRKGSVNYDICGWVAVTSYIWCSCGF